MSAPAETRAAVVESPRGARTMKLVALAIVVIVLMVLAAYAKRSEVYLLTLYCVYLMATMGLNLTVGMRARCRSATRRSSASARTSGPSR